MGTARTRGSHAILFLRLAGSRPTWKHAAHAPFSAWLVLFCTGGLLVPSTSRAFAAAPATATPSVAGPAVAGPAVAGGAQAAADAPETPGESPFHEPNAVLVNVTQADLNRILEGKMQSFGGPVFEGRLQHPAKGIFDLQYWADISDPVLKLGADGEVNVSFSIREARIDVGRYERGTGKKNASCENLGMRVERDRPVDVSVGLRFAYEGGDLKILPDRVSIHEASKRIHLIEPTRCEGTLVPRQILWWVGKPALKHRLGGLDRILLASLKKSAARINDGDGEGLLGNGWELGPGTSNRHDRKRNLPGDLFVHPQLIDISRGSLFVSLAASSPRSDVTSSVPEWASSLSDRSFVALSQPLLNELARYAFARIAALPRKPGGQFAKVVKSDSLYSLVPGLREVHGKGKVYFTFKTSALPDVELHRLDANGHPDDSPVEPSSGAALEEGKRALIQVRVSGIEVDVWQAADGGDQRLGSLKIDSGRVGLIPYANPLGGVSFEMVENDWKVSSEGIEFDEDLFEATIQELVFGEVFETRYAPLFRDGLGAGDARLMPRTFRVIGDHLVIVFG